MIHTSVFIGRFVTPMRRMGQEMCEFTFIRKYKGTAYCSYISDVVIHVKPKRAKSIIPFVYFFPESLFQHVFQNNKILIVVIKRTPKKYVNTAICV